MTGVIEIHRLELRLDEEPGDALSMLTELERQMAGRYRQRADRVRSAATRAATRVLLARWLDCAPQAIDIAPGPHNKPGVVGIAGRAFCAAPLFNVSHSGGFSLIAIGNPARLACLGVDIEHRDPALDPFPIAEMGCTEAERRCLRDAPNPLDVLYPIWVAKEAVLKAVGVGIPDHLQSVSIELRPGFEIGVNSRTDACAGVQARMLDAPDGYAAAVAWRSKDDAEAFCRREGIERG
ncbi:4-phosphopantetheinyl transferase [Thauera sinica]|nr:4-phosphopantetheinyl transferase [Thauera sp. K11]